MPRPREEHPTPGELEVLKVLWQRGPSTVREVMEVLNRRRRRAYTSVMSLLNVMTAKGLLRRKPLGRAFVYEARAPRHQTLGGMVGDLLGRVFEGSAKDLVVQVLDASNPTEAELQAIRQAIAEYEKRGQT